MESQISAPAAAQLLIQAVISLRAAIYLAVMSLCLLVYDCAITIDQEVKFVWGQRWSFGKVVYIFIRYATVLLMIGHVTSMFLFRPSMQLCYAIEAIFVWLQVAIIIAGSSVLVVRTWLLWGGTRSVLAALIGSLVVVSVLSIYYVHDDTQQSRILLSVSPQLLPGCLVDIPSTVWRPFVFPLIYETFIVTLTVIKVASTRNRAPLMMRLLLDGTLYYVVVIAVLLLTTIGAAYKPTRALVIGSGFHTVCISIGCSRLVLSLHSWSHENKRRSTAHSSQSGASKHGSHHSPSSSLSNPFSKKFVPTQPEYELALQAAPDIESGKTMVNMVNSNATATTVALPQAAVPDPRSMLPDIERPSLPERMWSKSSLTHAQPQQRQHRPPRSSSLYPVGPTVRTSGSRERLIHTSEVEQAEWSAGDSLVLGQRPTIFDTPRKYNVI